MHQSDIYFHLFNALLSLCMNQEAALQIGSVFAPEVKTIPFQSVQLRQTEPLVSPGPGTLRPLVRCVSLRVLDMNAALPMRCLGGPA